MGELLNESFAASLKILSFRIGVKLLFDQPRIEKLTFAKKFESTFFLGAKKIWKMIDFELP